MKIKTIILLSMLTTLTACTTTSGGPGVVSKYSSNWQGWDSVLQVAQDALTNAEGIPLVDIADMQARTDGAPQQAELTPEQQQQIAEAQEQGLYPGIPTSTGNIILTIFANDQLYNTKVTGLPLDTFGVPTASAAPEIYAAAAKIKVQAFESEVIHVPDVAIPDVSAQNAALVDNTVIVSEDSAHDSNESYQDFVEPTSEPTVESNNNIEVNDSLSSVSNTVTIIDSSSIEYVTDDNATVQ